MKTKDLITLQEIYGDIKISEIVKLLDRPYKCPKCNGEGGEQKRYNAYPSGLPDSGWVEEWKFKYVQCDLCEGHGYTKRELKPVTKTEVVGYI